jgi:hypothetical protein
MLLGEIHRLHWDTVTLYVVPTISKKTHPLKLVTFTVNVPSAAAMTGVEVSMFAAMLVLPHGEVVLGLCTSDR